jgi:hypothetical protein
MLFLILLGLGVLQSRNRTVTRNTLATLPIAMLALSLIGVLTTFGPSPIGLAAWLAGAASAAWLGVKLITPSGVSVSSKTRGYVVPGSWEPLTLMMAIFFMKYAVGVFLARRLSIVHAPVFIGAISLSYGLLSGLFLARARGIMRLARQADRFEPNTVATDSPLHTAG